MKVLKHSLFLVFSLIGLLSFTSCESEEEMGAKLVNGYCWQGYMPIEDYYGWNDYYSRFFFDGSTLSGQGIEEVYRNGRYNGEYPFYWYWEDSSFGVLVLDYGHRWDQKSCIQIMNIGRGVLRGYFYEYIEDYYDDKFHGFPYDRDFRYVELTTKQYSRYH